MKKIDISLGPTINLQGFYNLLCICAVRKIVNKEFTALPMPESIKLIVEIMEAKENPDKRILS